MTILNFKRLRNISLESYCLLFVSIFTGLAINSSDTTLAPEFIRKIIQILCYLLTLVLFFRTIKKGLKPKYFIYTIVPLMIFWLMGIVNVYSGGPQWATLFLLEIIAFALTQDSTKRETFNLYVWYLTLMSLLGLLVVVSFLVFPFLPYTIESFYGENSNDALYFNYTIAYLFIDNMDGMRLCGLFNEPGYFGTMLALAIVAENFNIKKPRVGIMLVAGFFTFSVAFFVTLVAFLIFRNCNRPLYLFVFMIALYFFYEVLPTLHFEDRMLDILVQRISFENGSLAGDNRDYIDTTLLMNDFNNSNDIVFGRGFGATKGLGVSFKMMIVQLGYVGVFLTYGLLFFAGWKYSKDNWIAISFLLCFTINVYQRTNIFCMNYFVVLFGGLLYIKQSVNNKLSKSLNNA